MEAKNIRLHAHNWAASHNIGINGVLKTIEYVVGKKVKNQTNPLELTVLEVTKIDADIAALGHLPGTGIALKLDIRDSYVILLAIPTTINGVRSFACCIQMLKKIPGHCRRQDSPLGRTGRVIPRARFDRDEGDRGNHIADE